MDGWMERRRREEAWSNGRVDIGSARLGGWLLLESVAGALPPLKRAFSAPSTDLEQGVCLRPAPHHGACTPAEDLHTLYRV
jgi:hypothetical protein